MTPYLKKYYVLELDSAAEFDIEIKVQNSSQLQEVFDAGTEKPLVKIQIKQDTCPLEGSDENQINIVDYQRIDDSPVYAFRYDYHSESRSNGSVWYFSVESILDFCQAPNSFSQLCNFHIVYSVLVTRKYICIPECQHGGTCSNIVPNSCWCEDLGYSGFRCELREYLLY